MLPPTSRVLPRVTPSALQALECPARVAFSQTVEGGAQGRQRSLAADIGTAIHLGMEAVLADGHEPRSAWHAACRDQQLDFPGIHRVGRRFERCAADVSKFVAALEPSGPLIIERWFESGDGAVGGIPDLVVPTANGLVIVDYKSGLVMKDGQVDANYENQLLVYSGIVSSSLARPVVRAALVSFRGQQRIVDIDVSGNRPELAVEAGRAAMREFNARVPGEQPPAPSVKTCQWCDFAAQCQGFWGVVGVSWAEVLPGAALLGAVSSDIEFSASGTGAMKISTEVTSLLPGEYLVVQVPRDQVEGVAMGDRVAFVGLRSRTVADETTLRWDEQRSSMHVWGG